MILTSFGIRLPLYGDGKSDEITIDLSNTLVIMGVGDKAKYCLIPAGSMPHVVLDVTYGGPSVTPESEQQHEVVANLIADELTLKFYRPLLKSKEAYTVEIIFGRMGVQPQTEVQKMDEIIA